MNEILNNPDSFRALLWIPLHLVAWLSAFVAFCGVWWWWRCVKRADKEYPTRGCEYRDLCGAGIASILLRVLFVVAMIGISFSCVERVVEIRFPQQQEAAE